MADMMIPEGWSVNTLSNLALIDRKSLSSKTDPNFQFKYIDIASVKTAKIDFPSNYISFKEAPSRARRCVQVGDVLMSTVRPNLQSFAYFDKRGEAFVASTGFAVITAKNISCGKFLYYSILSNSVARQIEALVVGSNYPAINSADVKNLEILFPPLPEQQKIATILTSVDTVIEKTRAQIDKLKHLKTGMMQQLLTQGIGHTEFKDSPVGRIPKSWTCELISSLFEIQLGKMLNQAAKTGAAPMPYLGNKNIQWGKVDITDLQTMDFSKREREKFLLKPGDLLMCEGGEVGRSAIWEGELKECYYQKAIHRLRPINDAYEPQLLLEYMRYAKERNLLADFISQTSIAHLTREKLSSIPIPVPPMAEQKKMVDIITSIDSRVNKHLDKLKNTFNIKNALMQDLLTGKVRVTTSNKTENTKPLPYS